MKGRVRASRIVALTTAAVLVFSAAGPAASPVTAATRDPVREWRTWFLESPGEFRLNPPPAAGSIKTRREIRELLELQRDRTKKQRRQIRKWTRHPATTRWTRTMLRMFRLHTTRPPFAARALALSHTAMYDAVVAAADSKHAYGSTSRPAPSLLDRRIRPLADDPGRSSYAPVMVAVAGAAERVLAHLFPEEPARTFEGLADQAARVRLWAGANYRSDVRRARRLGHKIADVAIAHAQADGSDNTGFAYPRPEGEEFWSATGPSFEPPTGGPVGTWKTWAMPSPDAVRDRVPPPHAYGSEQFMIELREVMEVQATLTDEQARSAYFWVDGPGTFTPAGHWNDIALDLVKSYRPGTAKTAKAFALLNAALADAVIASFEIKYFYWSIRPITSVWRLCDGDARLCTESEASADENLAPYWGKWYPIIATPPFPSYVSGHATISGAAAAVLGELFPSAAEGLNRLAEEAAMSRLYGGIHFRSDNDQGLVLGRAVADLSLRWPNGS